MLEQKGDIWEARQPGDYVVITTNGTRRKDGCLVMGRGIAKEAAVKYPHLPIFLGNAIRMRGLQVEVLLQDRLIVFPVKIEFYEKASLGLIETSTRQLLQKVERLQLLLPPENAHVRILLPRPGCGFGRRDWAEVKPIISHYLTDDRFIVFSK